MAGTCYTLLHVPVKYICPLCMFGIRFGVCCFTSSIDIGFCGSSDRCCELQTYPEVHSLLIGSVFLGTAGAVIEATFVLCEAFSGCQRTTNCFPNTASYVSCWHIPRLMDVHGGGPRSCTGGSWYQECCAYCCSTMSELAHQRPAPPPRYQTRCVLKLWRNDRVLGILQCIYRAGIGTRGGVQVPAPPPVPTNIGTAGGRPPPLTI